jgi:hypothetical protein
MDLRLFARVLRRFKFVAAIGFVLTAGLAFLSYVKVSPHGLRYRTPQTWSSTARVLIAADMKLAFGSGAGPDTRSLATLYASLASSDSVRAIAFNLHKAPGGLSASAGFDKDTQATLPVMYISAISKSPRDAARLANDGVEALNRFIVRQENVANTPLSQRVHLQYLNVASPLVATVAIPRSKTRPIMVFVLGLAATLGLILILENVRPRMRQVKTEIERAA